MTTKNKFGIRILFLTMFLISTVFVPVASAETLTEDTDNIAIGEMEYPVPEPEPITVLDTTPKSPYLHLLEADNEEQEILFGYIDNCYISDEEKEEMKKSMEDIWKRYPDQITEQDNLMLDKVAKATAEYLNDKYGNSEVGIKWIGQPVHGDIINISVKKWGVSDYYAGIARDHADDPDDWSDSEIWQSYHHYYNPNTHTGYAPSNCEYYANIAKTNYGDSQLTTAYTNLGYSSHYLQDVGNPLHTGYEVEQGMDKWIHYDYEDYVEANWDSGYNFKSIVENNNNYYTITDPEQATKDLAGYSNTYLDELYQTIYFNPDTWENDADIRDLTEDVLLRTAKYNLGLVKYMRS